MRFPLNATISLRKEKSVTYVFFIHLRNSFGKKYSIPQKDHSRETSKIPHARAPTKHRGDQTISFKKIEKTYNTNLSFVNNIL